MSCSVSHKLDGLLISSENWNVVKFKSNLNLVSNFTSSREFGRTYEEVFESDSKFRLRIHIGMLTNLSLSFLIDIDETIRWYDMWSSHIEIKKMTVRVVESMKNSNTYKDWITKSNDKQKQLVYLDDVVEFGNRLRGKLLSFAETNFGSTKCKLIIAEFGQDCDFNNLGTILSTFNLEFAEKAILHYAVDYEFSNSILMFNREELVQCFGRKNLKNEYYVALLRGNGNFYFKMSENLSPAISMVEAKFYSEVFKEFHRTKPIKFLTPEIAKMLFNPRSLSKGFCNQWKFNWENRLASIESVKRVVDSIGISTKSLKTRFEAVAVINGDDIKKSAISIPILVQEHPTLNATKVSQFLKWMPIGEFSLHLRKTLVPFITTVETFVAAKVQAERNNSHKVCSPDQYLSCLASEAVICFALYGNATWREGKCLYPSWLTNSLGLTLTDFRHDMTSDEWPFPNVTSGTIVKFQAMNFKLAPVLKSLGLNESMSGYIMNSVCSLESFLNDHMNDQNFTLQLDTRIHELSKLLVQVLVDSAIFSLRSRIPRNFEELSWKKKLLTLYDFPRYQQKQYFTTAEFLDFLFSRRLKRILFFYWIIEIVEFLLTPFIDPRPALKLNLRDALEEALFSEALFLFLDDDTFQTTYVVIPVAGIETVFFDSLDLTKKNRMILMYKQEFTSLAQSSGVGDILKYPWLQSDKFSKVMEKFPN